MCSEKISKLIGVEDKSKNAAEKREKSDETNDEDYQNLIQAKRLSKKSNSSCPRSVWVKYYIKEFLVLPFACEKHHQF